MIERHEHEHEHDPAAASESGKVGKAFLMWILGVPGVFILLYLLLAH